ncbi:MAG: GPI inositol-deacylase [Fibrobacterales bacterium]
MLKKLAVLFIIPISSLFAESWEGCPNPSYVTIVKNVCKTTYDYQDQYGRWGEETTCSDVTNFHAQCPEIGIDGWAQATAAKALSRAINQWNALSHPSMVNCNVGDSNYQKIGVHAGCLERPVLFVHGLATDGGSWRGYNKKSFVMSQLAEAYGAHIPLTLETELGQETFFDHNGLELYEAAHKFQPIETGGGDQTELLANRMSEVLTQYYGESWKSDMDKTIDIIAHSQGGLVIRNALRRYNTVSPENPLNHVHGIITLNTPHTGSALATENSNNSDVQAVRKFAIQTHSHERLKGFKSVHEALGAFIYGTQDLSQNSGLIADLKAEGYPRLPFSNKKIPMVALTSSANSMGEYLLNAVEKASEECDGVNVDAGELHEESCHWEWTWKLWEYGSKLVCETENVGGDIGDVFVDGYELGLDAVLTAGHSFKEGEFDWYTRNDAAQYVCNEAADIAIDYLWDNYLKGLNENWADKGDFIVELESQEGRGVFTEGADPFKIMNLNDLTGMPTIPHMPMLIFPNGVYYGPVFLQAYKELNELKDLSYIVPTIITPLLLN